MWLGVRLCLLLAVAIYVTAKISSGVLVFACAVVAVQTRQVFTVCYRTFDSFGQHANPTCFPPVNPILGSSR